MAEGVLFDLGMKVLEVVGSLALQEIKLACGVKAELENLKSTVSTIQAVLLDAEKQGSHNNEVKDWLKKLRDVFLDADDVLDDFSTEALQHKVMTGSKMTKVVRIFFSSSNQLAFSLKMGHRIKAIRERLNVIAKDKDNFHFIQNSVEPQVMNRDRETYSFVLEEDVVGREDDKKEIIKLLLDANTVENVSIIPIVGIGGLGKTTLAQLIYNDEIVKNNFELKFWICLSDNFDIKHIVKQILESLGNGRDEESLDILQNHLREKLNGKKYFLVLDDLWNEDIEKWLLLKDLLMGGARGSRIVVTTRLIKVADITGTTPPHELKGLDPEKAWSLFTKMAFKGGKEPENQGIIDLGKEIMGKCIGVPLAIRTIGSLLYGKTSKIEWQSFLDDELSKLAQQENKISLTLKLSYDHLPSHLKQCFAYCRLFPKDYLIDVVTLINLWAAQGFIVLEGPRQCFVDIGRKYFMELLWRSFFQDVRNDEWGNIKSCKMHDLMHDLATLVSGLESAILNSSGENDIEKVRHVSFNLVDSSVQLLIPMLNGRKIHTILALSTILPSVVVRMEGSRGQVKKGHCGSCKEKKAESNGGPSQLKLLHNNLGGELRIENLGHGKDEVRECKDANLKDKQHLQHLVLKWDVSEWDAESECYDEMSLEGLQPHPNLKALKLQDYTGVRIPSWVSSLTNLVHFQLYNNWRLQHLPPLSQLPFLKFFWLVEMEALEYIWIDEDSVSNVLGASSSSSSKTPFFPSLSSLEIRYCPKLKEWWRNEPHHLLLPSFPPSLEELHILGCLNLTSMPLIPDLTSLKVRRISGQRCKRQIGEDWPIIAHVPRVLADRQNQQKETFSSDLLLNFQALQLCNTSQNCKWIVRICRKQFLQNQLRQRTSLGAKFRHYSKTAIVQQVKNLVNHSKFLRTLKGGLDQATNTAGISLLNRYFEQIKDKPGLPCSKLYAPEIMPSTVLDSMNRSSFGRILKGGT
uniref:Disease resistance protein RGA3 n=1 Tax=Quercus lobata TaxID=97700 RepID=A0A7N2M525_QUELO